MPRKSVKTPAVAAQRSAPQLRPQVVSNVGLYFAAYRLSQMGWNVMPTSRNARGVDILAYDMSARRFRGVQVKTLSKRVPAGPLTGSWGIGGSSSPRLRQIIPNASS